MKDMINYLFSQIGDEYTHTMKNVTTEALNCSTIFNTYVEDGDPADEKDRLVDQNKGVVRSIIDDIAVWSVARNGKWFIGVNTFQGEDLKCATFTRKPHIVTDYGMGVIWKDDDEKILGYAHRTKNGCKLIDMQNITLDGGYRPIGIVLDDKVDYNKYIVAFRNNTVEKSDKYYTCTFNNNKMYTIDSVNEIIYDYEGNDDIYNIKPISYDLFTYRRGSDGTNCIFSKYYNKTLNEFNADYDILRVVTGYPDSYDSNGSVILYLPEWDGDIITGGDVYIASLVSRNKDDMGKAVLLNSELTHIFKPVHGLDSFYCVIPKKDEEENHTFIFFKMEYGKFITDTVKASSIPGEIYVCKDTCCISLEYDTNGYHQVASFWEDEMDMYKYSHIDIRLNKGVDSEVVLTKFKDHIDSLNTKESQMGDDEYFNLHYFRTMSAGATIDDQQYMESDQYANVTRNEIYTDISRIYMPYNGKIQFRQRTDNIIEEYISVNAGKTEERQNLIKEMYNETINEHDRIINEMKNESSNQNNTNNNN